MVREIQAEALNGADLTPDRASELLVILTALLANVGEEIRAADYAYAVVLLKYLDSDEAANRARIRAEISPEYQRKREARDTKEGMVELCRSLKYVIRSNEESMRLAR